MGFRDDFSNVVLSTTSHDMGSGALEVLAATGDPEHPVLDVGEWQFRDEWFVRRAGNLQNITAFDTQAGLPALPDGYLGYISAKGLVTLSGGAASPAARGAGVLGVRCPIVGGNNVVGTPLLMLCRASDGAPLALIAGPIEHASLKARTTEVTVSCWAGASGPQYLVGEDAPYWRIDADSHSGAVTCSITGDEAGKQVRDSFTNPTALPADGALMFAMAVLRIDMSGPASGTPPTGPASLLSVYSWAYAVSTVVAGDGDAGSLRR